MFKLNPKIPNWEMLSDAGNKAVDRVVVSARRQKLSWPEVYKKLWILYRDSEFGEVMDSEVTRKVYNRLNFRTPFYFYGITVNGKTLFDVFPDLAPPPEV